MVLARNPGSIDFLFRPEAGEASEEVETWGPRKPRCFFSQSFLLELGGPAEILGRFNLSVITREGRETTVVSWDDSKHGELRPKQSLQLTIQLRALCLPFSSHAAKGRLVTSAVPRGTAFPQLPDRLLFFYYTDVGFTSSFRRQSIPLFKRARNEVSRCSLG